MNFKKHAVEQHRRNLTERGGNSFNLYLDFFEVVPACNGQGYFEILPISRIDSCDFIPVLAVRAVAYREEIVVRRERSNGRSRGCRR